MENITINNANLTSHPLVSIVTPVYNAERYLAECIESVLAQTYENWEYVIVNNCSADGSLKIAQNFTKRDARIRVYNNTEFLSMVQNFNHSIMQISADSKYCKILHADDFLFPECLMQMVALAEQNPSIGIVGSYVLEGVRVKCDGLPYPACVVPGSDICRLSLMDTSPVNGGLYVFGSPTSLLIRSDLIRGRTPFYNDRYLQVVDQEACYHLLQNVDFGFAHQVLTYTRLHTTSTTSSTSTLNRRILEELMLLIDYGPVYLSKAEYRKRLAQRMDKYYKFFAQSVFERRGKDFWNFHREGLKRLGLRTSWSRLTKVTCIEVARKLLRFALHPRKGAESIMKFFQEKSVSMN